MKPNAEVTIGLLAAALSGLDETVNSGRSEQAPHDMLSGRLAAEALAAVAVTLKYLLAKEGQAILPGFGTFSVAEGATVFSPEEDLSDYVALAEGTSHGGSVGLPRLQCCTCTRPCPCFAIFRITSTNR